MAFHQDISVFDRAIILKQAGMKFIRGLLCRLFLKETHGLFFVGRNVQITHCRHIRCGKSVKIEDYAEIHGLCSEGIVLGNYVTISRGTTRSRW